MDDNYARLEVVTTTLELPSFPGEQGTSETLEQDASGGKLYQCSTCDQLFEQRSAYYRHRRTNNHPNQLRKMLIRCRICHLEYTDVLNFYEHLKTHKIGFDKEIICFDTWADFDLWRSDLEEKSNVRYVKDEMQDSSNVVYFKCANDWTSLIVLNKVSGKFYVTFYKTQQNDIKIEPPGTNIIDVQVVDKSLIKTEVSDNCIDAQLNDELNKIQDSLSVNNVEGMNLLIGRHFEKIKVFYNVESDFAIVQDEFANIDSWVGMRRRKKKCPVIFYKKEGTEHLLLDKGDFALGLMDDAQLTMLKQYHSVICFDVTEGDNPFNLTLFSLFTIDGNREAFPVAFFYTNRNDELAVSFFINVVKKKCGNVRCDKFMSADSDKFYNIWVEVMEGWTKPKKFLLPWDVDRIWRSKLSLIPNRDKLIYTYKMLKAIQNDENEELFSLRYGVLKEKFLQDDDMKDFGSFFIQNYENRFEEWARYKMQHLSGYSHLEHFLILHETVKFLFMENNRIRLFQSVFLFSALVKNKCFERINKVQVSSHAGTSKNMRLRHARAEEMEWDEISRSGNGWIVTSQNDLGKTYTVTRNIIIPEHVGICKVRCGTCGYCIHCFSCTCPDHMTKGEMCKHIHCVCINLERSPDDFEIDDEVEEVITDENIQIDINTLFTLQRRDDPIQRTELMKIQLNGISAKINKVKDVGKIEAILEHLKGIYNLIRND